MYGKQLSIQGSSIRPIIEPSSFLQIAGPNYRTPLYASYPGGILCRRWSNNTSVQSYSSTSQGSGVQVSPELGYINRKIETESKSRFSLFS